MRQCQERGLAVDAPQQASQRPRLSCISEKARHVPNAGLALGSTRTLLLQVGGAMMRSYRANVKIPAFARLPTWWSLALAPMAAQRFAFSQSAFCARIPVSSGLKTDFVDFPGNPY